MVLLDWALVSPFPCFLGPHLPDLVSQRAFSLGWPVQSTGIDMRACGGSQVGQGMEAPNSVIETLYSWEVQKVAKQRTRPCGLWLELQEGRGCRLTLPRALCGMFLQNEASAARVY